LIYIELKEFLKYSNLETGSETSKFGDRSLGIPVEIPRAINSGSAASD